MRNYRSDRNQVDHMIDLVIIQEMGEINVPEKNPWGYCDEDGWLMNPRLEKKIKF